MLDHSGFSPLLWAAAFGRVGVIKMLLNDGGIPSNLDEVREQESSLQPLHVAACVGAEGVCQSLLKAEAKVHHLLSNMYHNKLRHDIVS